MRAIHRPSFRTCRPCRFCLWLGLAAVAAAALPAARARADFELPRESPPAKLSQQIGLTEIAIEYSSPAVKGRKIWGGLVPYGKPWGIGGYQAPRIRFSRDVSVGGKPVPAGTYSLFAIPEKGDWTVVVNRNADQLGSGRDYRAELDVARVRLRPKTVLPRERLTFVFSDFTDDDAALQIEWDKLALTIPIAINTTQQVMASLVGLDSTWRSYANAARYMLETKKDYEAGLKYIDQSLALKEDWYNVWIKALLCAARADYKGAEKEAERAYDLGLKSGDAFFPEAELRKARSDWSLKSVAAR
jgi:DUF2911 family protein